MPKIRTHTVEYTVDKNQHKLDVNVMYDTNQKIFYIQIPKSFTDAISTLSTERQAEYNIEYARGIRGLYGLAILHKSEEDLITGLYDLFTYCGNAAKQVRNVIVVWSNGKSTVEPVTTYRGLGSNKERYEIFQKFYFVLAVETKVGDGVPIYTYQDVTYTNTFSVSGYSESAIVIDDTPENRLFLEDVYAKFDALIINLQKFFKTSDSILELIQSNLKLLN